MNDIVTENSDQSHDPPQRLLLTFKLDPLEHVGAVLGLLTLLGVWRFTALTHLNTHYLGGFQGDAGLYSWLMNLNARDLLSPWFETFAFYPYGYTLAWSDNFILPSLFAGALFKLGLQQPLVFNLIILAAEFLNGYIVFRLFYRLSGETMNSFCAGCAGLSLSYFTFQLGHPQLQFFFWIPLALLLLFRYLDSRSLGWALLCGAVLCGSFLTTVYYSIFAALAMTTVIGTIFILRPQAITIRSLVLLALGILIGSAPVWPFVFPYLDVRETFGAREIYEAYYFAATPLSYLSSTPYNLLYEVTAVLTHSEAHLFSGITLLTLSFLAFMRLGEARRLKPRLHSCLLVFATICVILAIWPNPIGRFAAALLLWILVGGFIRLVYLLGKLERELKFAMLSARDLIAIFSAIALVFFIISLGPLGNPVKGQAAIAPYRLLYELMPGFDSIRAISRAGVLVMFATVILFALEISYLSSRRTLGGALLLPLAFVMIENYSATYPLESAIPAPQAVDALSKLEHSSEAAIVLPYAGKLDRNNEVASWSEFARLNVTYLHWLFPLKIQTVNGYSGQRTKLMKELPRELRDFPDRRALQAIGRIGGLRYIVYTPAFDAQYDAFRFHARMRESADQLELLGHYDDGSYLFEAMPVMEVNEDLFIWLPSRTSSSVSFELRARNMGDQGKLSSEVFMKDEFDLVQLSAVEIDAAGQWQQKTLPLPPAKNRVRPVQITFAPKHGAEMNIRNVSFNY